MPDVVRCWMARPVPQESRLNLRRRLETPIARPFDKRCVAFVAKGVEIVAVKVESFSRLSKLELSHAIKNKREMRVRNHCRHLSSGSSDPGPTRVDRGDVQRRPATSAIARPELCDR
jgi:hypothetical protein